MIEKRMGRLYAAFGLTVSLLLAGEARAAQVTYQIVVNTSSLKITPGSGYLDFEFNPGVGSDAGSATLSAFTTNGTLTTPAAPAGAVSGSLPGTVTISNTDALNEYTPGFVYGSFFDIFVTLNIPTVSGTATGGNSFTLDVEDSGFNPLLSSSFPALEIDLSTLGSPTITNNAGSAISITKTPEPATFGLVGMALSAALFGRRFPFLSRSRAI